jgi:hypothetical protein
VERKIGLSRKRAAWSAQQQAEAEAAEEPAKARRGGLQTAGEGYTDFQDLAARGTRPAAPKPAEPEPQTEEEETADKKEQSGEPTAKVEGDEDASTEGAETTDSSDTEEDR